MASTAFHAETIISNANILTIDPTQPRAQALAIRDGKFLAVGSNDDVSDLKGKGTTVLDLKGKTVLPGFIDAHTHVMSSGPRHVAQEDCDLRSIGEIQEALKGRARTTPAGQWVLGFKFDDTKTSESRFLDRRDLDAVSTQHPVMVAHQAGHVYFFNSRGLEAAGFHQDSRTPRVGAWAGTPTLGSWTD